MSGTAKAPAGGTILMAFPTHVGSAFAIDEYVYATVELDSKGSVDGRIRDEPTADTTLIERCVELVIEQYGQDKGACVETSSEVNMASGLKSSSAAANATVLATLDALDRTDVSRVEAMKLGVRAARETGVTVTGAYDDASASMLGGVTLTNNDADEVLLTDKVDWTVLIWSPPERAFSSDVDVDRCRRTAPMATVAEELIRQSRYEEAMTLNGLFSCAALDYPTDLIMDALGDVRGVTLSGSGPSFIAIGSADDLEPVCRRWSDYDGDTRLTETQSSGATIIDRGDAPL